MQFWQKSRTQESYRRMIFNDASSPIKELIYVTTRKPLRPITGRKYVTTRYLRCRSTCFSQQLYNDEHDFLEAESLTHANEKSYIISHNWEADGLTKFQTRDRQYLVSNVQTRHFPLFIKDFSGLGSCRQIVEDIDEEKFQALCAEAEMENSILEKEPIDVVFKYIDLSDPNLVREGIPQIKKDEDNEELRYALRSVLQNLPWVRRIFIIMPNEQVRFLKPQEEIAEKITYIKDKDFLGFDSASSIVFEFNLWRLHKFGVSENFIYMNDDYFIGRPLKKSDFFYVEKGKVVPYLLYSEPLDYKQHKRIIEYHKKLSSFVTAGNQCEDEFQFQKMSALLLNYKYFGRDILSIGGDLSYFPHNALGENTSELREMYDMVRDNYEYPDDCFNSTTRKLTTLVQQTTYTFFILNKYHRRINPLNDNYVDLIIAVFANYNRDLFCINTGGDKYYPSTLKKLAKWKMGRLFQMPTKYEL